MLLFSSLKLLKGRYYGQKKMVFACRETLHVCMSRVEIPISNQRQTVPMPRGGKDGRKQEPPTYPNYKSGVAHNWV